MPDPPLRIPDRFVKGFTVLRDLSDAEGEALETAFRAEGTVPSTATSIRGLRMLTSAALPDRTEEDADEIVIALLGLSYQSRTNQIPSETLAAGVAASPKLIEPDQPEAGERLRRRLHELLTSRMLVLSGSTVEVASENVASFASARTIVDIRPVFPPAADGSPLGALLLVDLKIDYFDAQGNPDSFFVSLDLEDLKDLRGVMDRADRKVAALEEVLRQSSLLHLTPSGE